MTLDSDLHQLISQLDSYKQEYPTIEQLQSHASELWRLNLEYADKTPKTTGDFTQNLLIIAFDKFNLLLDQAWHVDASLLVPYTRLLQARNTLQHLRNRGIYSNADIARIQDEVNEVENEFVMDGKFKQQSSSSSAGEIVMGQAVLSSLLHDCHRLTYTLLASNDPVNAFIAPIHQKLSDINIKLDSIGPIEMAKLHEYQQELKAIEDAKISGFFVPPNWDRSKDPNAIPEGQAECQALLEDAYEKIYTRLCAFETESDLGQKITDASRDGGINYEKLQKYVWDGISILQNLASTAAQEAVSIGHAIARGYSHLNKNVVRNVSSYEMVDPKLSNTMNEIQSVLTGLKRFRVEVLFLRGPTEIEKSLRDEAAEKLTKLRDRLNEVDSKRVNGRFVGDDGAFAPKGQAALVNSLEESYAILHELDILLASMDNNE